MEMNITNIAHFICTEDIDDVLKLMKTAKYDLKYLVKLISLSIQTTYNNVLLDKLEKLAKIDTLIFKVDKNMVIEAIAYLLNKIGRLSLIYPVTKKKKKEKSIELKVDREFNVDDLVNKVRSSRIKSKGVRKQNVRSSNN